MTVERFTHPTYLIRKKMFKFLGGAFHVFDGDGNLVFYSRQKAFKLKEDIRLYTNESMNTEVLSIQARKVLDFSSAYDVIDSATGQKLGALRRKGWASMARDHWLVLDAEDREIAHIQEDSALLALVRRFVTNLIPQRFDFIADGRKVAEVKQNFNPFVLKLTVDFTLDTEGLIDRRVGLAAAILLCAIEGRQG
ncbi:hypothetical protein LCGC14_0454570 [marine sediment metagenome]|uniref:LURP-one-related family protein n=2 Tax=root TaxID=1 RepID=A0A9C9NFB2_9HYPH|nr:hypothetical protein [Phycisphaerae bacterium]HEU00833.1 hypothetical protein [Aurantimonas coralicida]